VAVLGSDCTLARAAAVAELTAAEARDAVDTLVAADVLAVGNELRFRHPIVRSAIYRELAPGARSIAHRAAATELAAHGASLDAVAGHLLRASPAGSRATIVQLREAADHALAIGAPESAVAYLDRALEEAPDRALRAELLLDLARAEQVAGLPSAGARFEEVQRLASDPVIRATAMIERARIDIYASDARPALTLLDLAIEELAGADEALRLRAEAVRAVLTAHDPRLVSSFVERLPIMRELAVSGQPGTRPLALLLAAWDADRDQPPGPVLDLIDRGWADGQYLDEGDSFELLPQTLEVLVGFEQFDRAAGVFQRIDSAARLNGSTMLQLTAVGHRALIEARRGDLAAAETELRAAVERALELELRPLAVSFLWYCSDVLVERPDAADVSDVLETTPPEPISGLHAGALLLEARARARFSRGARDEAIGDLRRAGAIYMALGVTGGRAATWRSALALMLGPAEREEALALSSAELERARRAGNLRRIGIALRALGTLEQSQSRLEEAVRVLARSPAQLEHARALVELGGARRRQGERAAGAAALRAGLELATRCGAVRLGERAELELAATGSRSRRDVATGYDELTPSELRVARLAADGRTSREIAEELFVTVRTVNTHLNHAYRKLGINSRKQLADTLASRA
jgi:DNA-binding CsgD family transcriptional regulator